MGGLHDKEPIRRNEEIELGIERRVIASKSEVKLLLLGTGESGKSTIVKQMRIIHMKGYTHDDYIRYRAFVHGNVLTSMSTILMAMSDYEIRFDDPDRELEKQMILEAEETMDVEKGVPSRVLEACRNLWADSGVQRCYKRGDEYELWDCAKFLFDVGGQRSERKKWIHCFDDVFAVIFCVALSEYDQVLFEDGTTNRMYESLRLFEAVCNIKFFLKTTMIVFLNKTDLFYDKLPYSSLTIAFPDYQGKQDFEEASEYVKEQFEAMNGNNQRAIYVHKTCATNTANIEFVFDAVSDVIVALNLGKAGLVN